MNAIDLNTIGLIFDIIGVALLFFFGLTKNLSKSGTVLLALEHNDSSEIRKWKMYNLISIIGFIFIIIGFTLQIISNYPEKFCL